MSAQNDAPSAIKAHLAIIRAYHGRLPAHTPQHKYYLMAESVYTRLRSPPAMPRDYKARGRQDLCLFAAFERSAQKVFMTITLFAANRF
jgi:hypothetical protein